MMLIYKRYIACLLVASGCILGMIAGFNYRMDPGNIFGGNQMIEECGNWLLDGHDVWVWQNFIDRHLQRYLIQNDSQNYEVLVFGSSRTMPIGRDLFPGMTMRNYSVSGASMEDVIALYFLYERYHAAPRKVVIGMDAWFVARGLSEWKHIASEYVYGKEKLTGGKTDELDDAWGGFEKYVQLISWPYFMASIEKCKKKGGTGEEKGYCLLDAGVSASPNANIIYSDGSREVDETKEANAEEVKKAVFNGGLANLARYDIARCAEMQSLLEYLRNQGIEVVLYFTPYHPVAYSYAAIHYQKTLEAEKYFRTLAPKLGFRTVGAYNPAECGVTAEDFRDAMHLHRKAETRILAGKL